jgi:ribosomal protein S18 acetylase RimI-like enzyme
MVTVAYHGKGVGDELMTHALCWMGDQADVTLGVIYYNERAIRFYEKFGFRDTGKIVGNHKIPRKLLIKPGHQT